MKNIIIKIIGIAAAFLLFVSASKPSLDGRALVAAPGELPPGLYVKAATFLPGDTVLITNPAAKVSVEALVFASFSAAEGVAVVLSPEAAKLLFITKDTNNIVQVTKNGGDMELSVLSRAFDSVPQTEIAQAVEVEEVQSTTNTENAVPADTILSETMPEEKILEAKAETTADTDVSDTVSEAVSEPIAEAENSGEVFTPFADTNATEDTQSVYEEPLVEVAEVPADEQNTQDEREKPIEDSASEQPSIAVLPADENTVSDADEKAGSTDEPIIAGELSEPEKEQNEPNVLIAAAENPPAAAEDSTEDAAAPEEADTADTAEENSETLPDYFVYTDSVSDENIPEHTEPLAEMHEYTDTNGYTDTDKYLIDTVSSLGAGTYCIQLATYKNKDNITDFITRYANTYPVRLLKSEKIRGAYQVVIGPLNKDEYPVVLKRFVSWGFKDAFLREIR